MKKLLLQLLILFPLALSAQEILDVGIFNDPAGSDKLQVRLKPTETVTNGNHTAGVFTVRFLSTYGVTLTAPTPLNNPLFRYGLANQGTDGTYNYYSFSFVSPFTVNWTAGVEYPIAILQINAGCGNGNGTFEVINNTWTNDNNGDVYLELNGIESQNIIYQATASAPLGVGMLDTIPPTITCPANQTVVTDLNACRHIHSGTDWDALGDDNCPGFVIQYILSGATVDTFFTLDDALFNKGLTNLSVTITDGAGQMDNCNFTVTVNDTVPPKLTPPPTVIVAPNLPGCMANGVVLGNATFSDNCPGAGIVNDAGATFFLGNTIITWTATDAAGLITTATQTVTVQTSLSASALNLSRNLMCSKDTATISFSLSGGTAPYSLVYSANGVNVPIANYMNNQPITVSPSVTTGYTLVSVTDTFDCTVFPLNLTDTLTVLPLPTLSSLVPSDSTICQGDSVAFTANGLLPGVSTTFNYTLSPGSPASLTGMSSATGTFTFPFAANPPGDHTMSIQSITVDGCTANFTGGNSGTYTVKPNPTLSSLQASATNVCQGDSVTITANGLVPNQLMTFNYTLTPGSPASQTGTSSAAGTFTFKVASNQPGMVTVTIQSITMDGCSTNFNAGNTTSFTVKPSPTLSSLQASASAVCVGEPVSFIAHGLIPNDSTTFQYTLSPGGPGMLTGVSSAAGTFTFAPEIHPIGSYGMSIQSITVNGCTTQFSTGNSGTYTVSALPTISSILPSAMAVCLGTPVHIIANGLPPDVSATFTYTLNGTPGSQTVLSNSTGTAILLSAIYPEGDYTVTITAVTVAGCTLMTNLSTLFSVDPFSAMCGFTVAGRLATETGNGVEEATVTIDGESNMVPFSFMDFTDTSGAFSFVNTIPLASSYTITPAKNDNPLNGVTTYDLVLISKHILGSELLNSPYKMIAADANKSNSITTFDIVEFRRLILGIYVNLPNNSSWRFVDRFYVFPNPNNPFVPQFPVTVSETNLQMSALAEDFVALKVGDVNGTAVLGARAGNEARNLSKTLIFKVRSELPGAQVKAGETFTLHFSPEEPVAGYQFTLDLNDLEVLDIQGGAGMGPDHFGLFPDAVTASFVSGEPAQTGAFSMTFRARSDGMLSQMLGISSRITRAEAYGPDPDLQEMQVDLRFEGESGVPSFELFQNRPNPFSGATRIPFFLPEATEVRLTIYNELGSVLYAHEDRFEAGQNSFTLEANQLSGSGMLYYKVETSTAAAIKKMLRD